MLRVTDNRQSNYIDYTKLIQKCPEHTSGAFVLVFDPNRPRPTVRSTHLLSSPTIANRHPENECIARAYLLRTLTHTVSSLASCFIHCMRPPKKKPAWSLEIGEEARYTMSVHHSGSCHADCRAPSPNHLCNPPLMAVEGGLFVIRGQSS